MFVIIGMPEKSLPEEYWLEVYAPDDRWMESLMQDGLQFHENRYGHIGEFYHRTSVRYGCRHVSFGEIRDLSRHRPGFRKVWLVPNGFQCNSELLEEYGIEPPAFLLEDEEWAQQQSEEARYLGVYSMLLGTTMPFERTTSAAQLVYEAELRTGPGSHFRYAEFYRRVMELWFQRYPETRSLIRLGDAEPE